MKKNNKKAFTLVELLVVIAILAILATVSVVGYSSFTKQAKQSVATQELSQVKTILLADWLDGYVGEAKDARTITKTADGYQVTVGDSDGQVSLTNLKAVFGDSAHNAEAPVYEQKTTYADGTTYYTRAAAVSDSKASATCDGTYDYTVKAIADASAFTTATTGDNKVDLYALKTAYKAATEADENYEYGNKSDFYHTSGLIKYVVYDADNGYYGIWNLKDDTVTAVEKASFTESNYGTKLA